MVAKNLHACDLTPLASTPHVWFQAYLSLAVPSPRSYLPLSAFNVPRKVIQTKYKILTSRRLETFLCTDLHILSDFGTDCGKWKSAGGPVAGFSTCDSTYM